MIDLKYAAYKAMWNTVPKRMIERIGHTTVAKFLRSIIFRRGNHLETTQGLLYWEDLYFHFEASYRTFYRAQQRGIENRICRLARSILSQGAVAIDVGANYGFISLVMARSVGSEGRILSFEIDSNICKVFRRNVERNDLERTCLLVPLGAGSSESVGFVTVDQIVRKNQVDRVDFVKIDVDGTDYDVLLGAEKTLERFRPVVVVEMMENQKKIWEYLIERGYTYFIDQANQTVKPGTWPANLVASVAPVFIPERGFFEHE